MNAQVKIPERADRQTREHQRLKVVERPSNGRLPVLELEDEGTVFYTGEGPPISYDCGYCGSPLLVDIRPDQIDRAVLVCKNCGSCNLTPSD